MPRSRGGNTSKIKKHPKRVLDNYTYLYYNKGGNKANRIDGFALKENLIKDLIALTLHGKGDYFFLMTVNTRVITEIITILN